MLSTMDYISREESEGTEGRGGYTLMWAVTEQRKVVDSKWWKRMQSSLLLALVVSVTTVFFIWRYTHGHTPSIYTGVGLPVVCILVFLWQQSARRSFYAELLKLERVCVSYGCDLLGEPEADDLRSVIAKDSKQENTGGA